MAKSANIALGVVALGAAAYFYKEYDQRQKGQQTRNMKLKIVGVAVQDGDIVITIKMLNPNSENMEVQSFVGQMLVNGQKVADVKMFGDYIAKGNSEITIPLIVKPKEPKLFQAVVTFLKNKVKVTYTGTVNVNNAAIPLTLSYISN